MKKSNQFDIPSRQSQWAIVFIILRFLKRLLNQFWPFAIAFFLGRNSSFNKYELFFSGLGVFGLITSVVAYYRYYFYVSKDELIIRSGLFKKVKLNIPFERIQSINFRQTVLHRLFQVTELEIETAGSKKQESKLDALTLDSAEALRKLLLDKRDAALSLSSQDDELESQETAAAQREVILQLSNQQLMKVGLTQNHLAPIGILGGFAVSAFFYAITFDLEPQDILNYFFQYSEELTTPILIGLGIVILALSVLFSIVVVILGYYNLQFWREGEKFQVVQGLFTRREFAALDNKIQMLNWGQNPLQKWIGFYNVIFRQARSGNSKRSEFKIPGCSEEQVNYVKTQWLNKDILPFGEFIGVTSHYFWRYAIYSSIFFLSVVGVLTYFENYQAIPLVLGVMAMYIWMRWLKYKKTLYAYNDQELYIGGGIFGLRHVLLPAYKIQNVTITQSPYQWRRDLSTLVIDTAAGRVRIPYIRLEKAQRLLDQLIYKVEIAQKGWM